jgi:hypothetical protein
MFYDTSLESAVSACLLISSLISVTDISGTAWETSMSLRLLMMGMLVFLSLQADALQQNRESRIRTQVVKRRLDLKQDEKKVVIFVSLV